MSQKVFFLVFRCYIYKNAPLIKCKSRIHGSWKKKNSIEYHK